MNTYILILTLLAHGGQDGQGGVAMAEFANKESCESAGETWKNSLPNSNWDIRDVSSFYLCVPQESKE